MAEKALKRFEDELKCSICLDTYSNPKLLQCFHVYCQKCLVKLVVRDQQGQLSLTCPICRQATPVPASGVAGLRPAFQINHLLNILGEHKKEIVRACTAQGVERIKGSRQGKLCCPEHGGKEVDLYCVSCEKLVCVKCALKGGKHHSHDCRELAEAFEGYKAEITTSLKPMEKQLTTINKALAQLDARCEEVSNQRETIEADVHKTFRKLHKTLDVRKTELIGQLHQDTQKKLKELSVQREELEVTQARVSSCLAFMRESLKSTSYGEVLVMKRNLSKQVKDLSASLSPDVLQPSVEADMTFSVISDLFTECQTYGHIFASSAPDPSKCNVTVEGEVGRKCFGLLHVSDFKDKPCQKFVKSLDVKLMPEIGGTATKGSVKRLTPSQYKISYKPIIKGRHQVHIKVEGQHIRGSPFAMTAILPVEKLSTPVRALRNMKKPYGAAINMNDELVVAETGGVRNVMVFCPSGNKLVRSFCMYGFRPHGVAVDNEGNVFVTAMQSHRIHKFTSAGKHIAAVGVEGSGPLEFCFPGFVAFNASTNKLHVSDLNHRVQVLNSDLTFSGVFGNGRGSGCGQFDNPRGIASDSAGNVYVADCNNHRIQVFTAEGKFLRMFGRRGEGKGELNRPDGVAVDTSDMVYITEIGNCRVSVFNSVGGFLTLFGEQPRLFGLPCGIAVNSSGVVYVCDSEKHCVQVF